MEGAIAGDMKNMVATAPTEATAAIAPGGKGDIVVVGAWFATVSADIASVKESKLIQKNLDLADNIPTSDGTVLFNIKFVWTLKASGFYFSIIPAKQYSSIQKSIFLHSLSFD